MANPVTVSIPQNTWTLISAAVTSAKIYFRDTATGPTPRTIKVSYVLTGGAAPTDGVVIWSATGIPDEDGTTECYTAEFVDPVDIYAYATGAPSEAVIHQPIGAAAAVFPVSVVVNDVAIVAAPVGGINVPSDDGIVMDGFSDTVFQIYALGGQTNAHVDRTVTIKFQGSDDVSISATRRWVDLGVGYDLGTDTTAAAWTSVGLTALDALVDFDGYGHKRIRVNYTFDAAPESDHKGAVVINERRRA